MGIREVVTRSLRVLAVLMVIFIMFFSIIPIVNISEHIHPVGNWVVLLAGYAFILLILFNYRKKICHWGISELSELFTQASNWKGKWKYLTTYTGPTFSEVLDSVKSILIGLAGIVLLAGIGLLLLLLIGYFVSPSIHQSVDNSVMKLIHSVVRALHNYSSYLNGR